MAFLFCEVNLSVGGDDGGLTSVSEVIIGAELFQLLDQQRPHACGVSDCAIA